ncbi:MAG: thioredoxin [Bacteroidota bacterium]|nr:thioredoxin [Bacteroidota bacterium]MDX5404476.1 thioredoxin [Bacteroidota bacterium]MDX5428446.1 thioredoxin [Bacteroidota bacterium]MDX5506210.1 thioredoxin [Bacteroidota bacterium]
MSSFKEIIASEKPVLIDFYADWCQPCKMMGPIINDLKGMVGDSVTILKIDVDRNPKLAASLQIQGVPTLAVFQKGEMKWRQAGVVPAQQLKQVLDRYLVEQ